MDWQLFCTAFGAVGTTLGSLITAIAVVVAVIQYKQPLKKQVKLTVGTSIPVHGKELGEDYLSISLANTGIRDVVITNIYLDTGTKKLVVNSLMVDFTNENLCVLFPKKLPPEEIAEVWISYVNLAHALLDLVNRKAIKPTQKIRIVATDTTAGEYRSEWKFTPNDFINQYTKK